MSFHPMPQVEKKHYSVINYNRKEAWINFWYQINSVLEKNPASVLEIGPGNKTVTDILKKADIQVLTVDIDKNLSPDIVASVHEIPLEDNSFDLVLCSEVLEHLPYDLFLKSLKELKRIARKDIVICLPNAGGVLLSVFKIPILPKQIFFKKIPFFWKKHLFGGEHYWETGKRGYSISKIKQDIKSVGLTIADTKIFYDDPAHCFFILKK